MGETDIDTILSKPIISTAEYAKLMDYKPATIITKWRNGDPEIAEPVNPSAYKCYRFSTESVKRKMGVR